MKIKIAIVLIMLGIFLPIATIPFINNYNPRVGVIINIQKMILSINIKKYPNFTMKYKLDIFDDITSKVIQYDNTNITLVFPLSVPESEIKDIINVQFPKGVNIDNVEKKQYWEFVGWYYDVIQIPFRLIFLGGLIIIFIGTLSLLFIRTKHIAS